MKINEIWLDNYQLPQRMDQTFGHLESELEYKPREFFRERRKIHQIGDVEYYQNRINTNEILAIKDKRIVIGYCYLEELKDNIVKIDVIRIKQPYRKKGYGFAFYEIILFQLKKVLRANWLFKGAQMSWGRMLQDPRILAFGLTVVNDDDDDHENEINYSKLRYFPINIDRFRMIKTKTTHADYFYAVAADNIPDWINDKLIEPMDN